MNFKNRLIALVLLVVLCSSTALAQRDPSLISSRHYVGIEAGLNYTMLPGSKNFFQVYNFPFRDQGVDFAPMNLRISNLGGGLGAHIAGTLDLSLSDFLGLQGKVFYASHNTSNTETQTVSCPDMLGNSGTAEVESELNYNLAYIGASIAARLQLQPEGFYGIVGFDFNSLSSNSVSGSQKILSSTNDCQFLFQPSNNTQTGETEVNFGPNSVDDFFNSSQLDLKLGLGTFIDLHSNGMVLTPEFTVGIPLSSFFNDANETAYKNFGATTPTMWYATLSVALKFPFGAMSREEAYTPSEKSEERDSKGKYTNLKGKVTDAKTGKPIRAEVTVTDLNNSEVVAKTTTGSDGLYDIRVKAPGRYSVTADADDYLFGTVYYEVDNEGRILKGDHDLKLSSVADGRTRLLIFFDFNKDNLQPESYPELERAITIMKNHPTMEVEIAGYTDNVGSDTYNKELSQRRANSVKDYIVKHGIDSKRIQAKGYGEQNPILPNDADEGRAANRRVEFVVLKK